MEIILNMHKFSIIIPVYKVENYLQECIESVINQTYSNWELILVDDGSPDRCGEICDEYAAKDQRIRVIHKENGGLSSARNAGLNMANGDYVIFLDSDDYWYLSTMLEEINEKIDKCDPDILIFGMLKYFQNQNRLESVPLPVCSVVENFSFEKKIEYLILKNIYSACACDKVYKKELLDTNEIRFKEGFRSEDIDWCAKLLLCRPKICCIEKNYYVYRQQQGESISSTVDIKHLYDILYMIDENLDLAKKQRLDSVMHFLAKYYVMCMANTHRLSRELFKEFLPELRKYLDILQYDWSPWVRKVNRVKWIGLERSCILLGLYFRLKRG